MKESPTVKTLVITALLTMVGTIVGAVVTWYHDVELAKQKYQSELILKALGSNSANDRVEALSLLVHANLITDPLIIKGVDSLVVMYQKNPDLSPQVPSNTDVTQVQANSGATQTPELPKKRDNIRIYMLSGKKEDSNLDIIRDELLVAQYNVMNYKKNFNDPGRPDTYEIRYFNAVDSLKALALSAFIKKTKPGLTFPIKRYDDADARPGYMEIWLGR